MENEAVEMYQALLQEAAAQMGAHASADQVIVVQTAKGNTYSFANPVLHGVYDEESPFVQMLSDRDDAQVQALVCMWNSGEIDLPSMHFRKLLLAACGKNGEANILLRTDLGLISKKLAQTMPGQ